MYSEHEQGQVGMNGREITALARQIEENIDLTRQEAMRYIREHQDEIVRELVHSGVAKVRTNVGDFSLTLDDLKATAA